MKSSLKNLCAILSMLGLLISCAQSKAEQTTSFIEKDEIEIMEQEIKNNPDLVAIFRNRAPKELLMRFNEGKQKAEKEWQLNQSNIRKIKNLGTTKTLEFLPLIDWYTRDESLKGEAGVSYLIKTDKCTILFDVGLNSGQIDPSPLLHNMGQLGISLDDIDIIVISHNHLDHVGGSKWSNYKRFSLTNYQLDLGEKIVYTPIPMTYPGLSPICTEDPTIISEGVTTIGVISNQLFFMGYTPEQALAVNVEDKGIVLISGCGHQTLLKILERAEALFDEAIYGVIGGLHYPVTDSRLISNEGLKIQMYYGTGKVPWSPITIEEVKDNINLLKKRNPGVVGLSGHDSCDASIEAFRNAFPEIYKDIKVGEKIVINIFSPVVAEMETLPTEFALGNNYPNPFNPITTINYRLDQAGTVNLVIYDLLGRKVATLVDGVKAPGNYSVRWNAQGLASGVYICRVELGGSKVLTRKMLLLR